MGLQPPEVTSCICLRLSLRHEVVTWTGRRHANLRCSAEPVWNRGIPSSRWPQWPVWPLTFDIAVSADGNLSGSSQNWKNCPRWFRNSTKRSGAAWWSMWPWARRSQWCLRWLAGQRWRRDRFLFMKAFYLYRFNCVFGYDLTVFLATLLEK